MTDEYKEALLHDLEAASNAEEVQAIINRSVTGIPETDLYRYLVIIYLQMLQSEMHTITEYRVASPRKYNIRIALNYLSQLGNCRGITENKEEG
jgi:hypothetical protein